MAEATAREVAGWPVGRPFALRPRMQAITLEVILRAVFGVRDGQRMDRFRDLIPQLGEQSSVLDWLPFMQRDLGGLTPAARFRKTLAAVDELIYAEIAERRALGAAAAEREDVLTLLLSARHEDGSPMTDVELRDQLMTLLTAGHETTATGLSWALRAAAAHAGGDAAGARVARRGRLPRRGRQGDAAGAPGDRRRGAQADPGRRAGRLAAARRHDGAARDRRDPRAARPVPEPHEFRPAALPRRAAPTRTRGSRSAAACGAASAPRSRRSRCAWCCARCCAGCGCGPTRCVPSDRRSGTSRWCRRAAPARS